MSEIDRRERFAEERPHYIKAARELHARLGRGFSQSEWNRHARDLLGATFPGGVSENAVSDRFGRWKTFLRCAGVPSWSESLRPGDRARTHVRALEADYERVYGFLHHPPTLADYRRYGRFSHDPLARRLGLFRGSSAEPEHLTAAVAAFDADPSSVAPYFARPFDGTGPRKSEVRALFFALLPIIPGRHYVDRVDRDGASIIAVTRQGAYRLDVEFGVRARGGDAPRALVCWDSTADECALSLKDYIARAREIGLDRLLDVLPARVFTSVLEPRPGPVPYFTRPPRNEVETIALSMTLLPHLGRIRVLSVEARDTEEPYFDIGLLIFLPEVRAWRRCRVEVKFDARRFNKSADEQDALVCWSGGGSAHRGLPVLSLERFLEEAPFPTGPTLLDALPALRAMLASNLRPLGGARRRSAT